MDKDNNPLKVRKHSFAPGWWHLCKYYHTDKCGHLGASTQLAICSKSPCSIAISSWPYLQDAIYSSPPLQLSRKVVRTRSEHSSQSAHTLHYVRTHPGTVAERNLISAKLARLCGDSRPHWVQTEKAEYTGNAFFLDWIRFGLTSFDFTLWYQLGKL
jgi:hypothetical protein